MSVPKLFDDVIQYISGAVSRIFAPNEDSCPDIGVQPFDGESSKKSRLRDW